MNPDNYISFVKLGLSKKSFVHLSEDL